MPNPVYWRISRFLILTVLILAALLIELPGSAFGLSSVNESTPQAALPIATTAVLFNGSLGTTPAAQGFTYGSYYGDNPYLYIPAHGATETISNSVAILDSTTEVNDHAGNGGNQTYVPKLPSPLDRNLGFRYSFTVKLDSESHTTPDRAGFSVIAISQDLQGIELGFWTDHIWAQNVEFTHGEDVTYTTTTGLTTYDLYVLGGHYALYTGGNSILSGNLRPYSTCTTDPYCKLAPYTTPSTIFLGDDSTRGAALIEFSAVSVTANSGLLVTSSGDNSSYPPGPTVSLRQAVSLAPAGGAIINFDPAFDYTVPINLTAPLSLTFGVQILSDCSKRVILKTSTANPFQPGGNNILQGLTIVANGGPGLTASSPATANRVVCSGIRIGTI